MSKRNLFVLSISIFIFFACEVIKDAVGQQAQMFGQSWEISTKPFLPQSIVLDNNGKDFFYVAVKGGGVFIYQNINNPSKVGHIPISKMGNNHAMYISQCGDFLYVALGDFFKNNGIRSGIAIINVSNPSKAFVTDFWESKNKIKGSAIVVCDGDYAYLGAMNNGVFIFDVRDKGSIKNVSQFVPDLNFPKENPNNIQEPNARGMALKNNNLFVCYDAGGIRVLDVSNKEKVKEVGRYINKELSKQQAYNSIVINSNLAYVATDFCGMEVLDISDVGNINRLSWCNPWACEKKYKYLVK